MVSKCDTITSRVLRTSGGSLSGSRAKDQIVSKTWGKCKKKPSSLESKEKREEEQKSIKTSWKLHGRSKQVFVERRPLLPGGSGWRRPVTHPVGHAKVQNQWPGLWSPVGLDDFSSVTPVSARRSEAEVFSGLAWTLRRYVFELAGVTRRERGGNTSLQRVLRTKGFLITKNIFWLLTAVRHCLHAPDV